MDTKIPSKEVLQPSKPESQKDRQNKTKYEFYAEVHWDTAYIDEKYFIAHPLALDKLMKLQSQIKVQKNKLNLNQRLSPSPNNNEEEITEKSQIQNHRPVSALSRECKTQLNEVKQIKSKIKAQNQLLEQEEKYKKRVQEAKLKKQSKKTDVLPTNLKQQLKKSQIKSNQQSVNNKEPSHQRMPSKQLSNKNKMEQILNKPETNEKFLEKNNKQKSEKQEIASGKRDSDKNYISFHPDDAINSPRFEPNKTKSGKFVQRQDQQSIKANRNLRHSQNNTSKVANKSFVINYRKSPSISKQMRQSQSNGRKQLKSAGSAASRIQLQTLNKKIKQMQEKLLLVEQRQKQFQQTQKERLAALELDQNGRSSPREDKKISRESQLTSPNKIYDVEVRRNSYMRFDEQLKNQPRNVLQRSKGIEQKNLMSNKSSYNDDVQSKERPVFDFTIYKTRKLNIASTTVEYNYSEDWKKIKKERDQIQEKQKMMEQIGELKQMIRELKIERIKQESLIEQLEKKQKQKQSLNNLLNSKLQQKSVQISKLNSRLPSQKREKTQTNEERQRQRQRQRQKNSQKSEIRSGREQTYNSRVIFQSQKQRSELKKLQQAQSPIVKKQKIQKMQKLPPINTNSNSNLRQSPSKSSNKKEIIKNPRLIVNTSNPQELGVRQFHPYPLSRKGIVVRQVATDPQDKQDLNLNLNKLQQMSFKDKNYEPSSPASTGRKIFQLQFVKQMKKKPQYIEEQQPQIIIPNIKVQGFPIPNLPQTPSANISQADLLYLAKYICEIFTIKVESDDHIYMKKYKNCIIFKTPDPKKTVVWHYNGKFYVGGWDQNEIGEGKKNGEGFQFIPEKYYYQGQFLDGKKNGSGTMIQLNGNIYRGQWVKGLKHGLGAYLEKSTGAVYEGQWKQDKKDGKGILKINDRQFYDGTFIKSVKHGYGQQLFNNGDYYKGQYKMGRFHGKGRYIWKNGSSYDGSFVQGHREGIGRWKSGRKDFDIYFGQYKSDKKSGKGQYTWSNGCMYDGFFVNDLKHGQGRVEYPDGRQIRGYWQSGKLIEVDQNIEESQTASNRNQSIGRANKIMQISSKQLQPSKTLTRIS